MEKFYIDKNGKFLGSFVGSTPTGFEGSVFFEVPAAPTRAKDIWNFDTQEWRASAESLADAEAAKDTMKKQAYRDRSDPLFFKYQRGEATKEEWLAEIAKINQEFEGD